MYSNSAGRQISYSVHPSIPLTRSLLHGLRKRTGKSLDEWVTLVLAAGPRDEEGRRAWLTTKYGLETATAWMITECVEGRGAEATDPAAYLEAAARYVATMYSGLNQDLRSLYDALVDLALTLGDEVRICPCESLVPLFRNQVFAEIRPTTSTRVDLGLALKGCGRRPIARLIDTRGLERTERITHRFAITTLGDIDDDVEEWMRVAYDLDG